MKFTKLTSSVLAGATLLSILAPTASFAATVGTAAANDNGGTVLPQKDKTEVGVSFGDNTHNANTGYLRLQMVPHVLDFGNHKVLDAAYPIFTADGVNQGKSDNNRHPNYDNGDTNMTAILNSQDKDLSKVTGDAWATVVDKQVTRKNNTAPTTAASGSWKLDVAADNALASVSTDGTRSTTDTINNATLSFTNTAYGQTTNVFGLTAEAQDSTWATDLSASGTTETAKAVSTITANPTITLAATPDATSTTTVATAKDGEGQGANVFGWKPSDIKLTMPTGAVVNNAVYKANLTWTLSSTVA